MYMDVFFLLYLVYKKYIENVILFILYCSETKASPFYQLYSQSLFG